MLLSSCLFISFSAEAGVPEGLVGFCIPSQGLEGVTEGDYRMFLVVAATSTGYIQETSVALLGPSCL